MHRFYFCVDEEHLFHIREKHSHLSSSLYLSFHLSGITSNVELGRGQIVGCHLSYNTKDRCPRLGFDNSFHDQPAHQTCVYVVFGNPSADTGFLFLSRLQSRSIFCPQGHSFERIPMDMSLQGGKTKHIQNAISMQVKKNTIGN